MKTRVAVITVFAALLAASSSFSRPDPFEKLPDGSLRHTFSGFVFPERIDVFQREQTHQFNAVGSDVSAGYYAGGLIVATVYVYPAPNEKGPEVLSREYASKRAEVLQGHQTAAVFSEDTATVTQDGRRFSGKQAYFTFRDVFREMPQDLKSQLLVFHDGTLFIEYRFTYPRNHAEEAEREIAEFIRTWSWRG